MSEESKMYVGDIGTLWRIDVGSDVSAAITYNIQVRKPDGTAVTWSATLDTDGQTLLYTIASGDYNLPGVYTAHAEVIYADGTRWLGERFNTLIFAQWK